MRILQVTDCHIVPDVGREILGTDTFRGLQRVLEAALSLREPPELIVATGDLSDDGSEGSYRRLRQLLLDTHLPVYVLPGNHDSVSAMQQFLVGGAIKMARHVDLQRWRIVFLDSKVADKSFGYLKDSELEYLVGALTEHPLRPVAACLHHSPTRPCPATGCRLENDAAFVELLNAHENARVVVSGHAHLESEQRIRYGSLFTTPASSAQCAHAPAGQLVDHEDFWASHRFDASRHGYRMLALHADGRFDTKVHWIPAAVERNASRHDHG